ncbi:hypothetical protein HER21_39100, partial [Pseudomonas sp. BGM005]|nr:hypothetical protein [Pseudomonas sp. BG5]
EYPVWYFGVRRIDGDAGDHHQRVDRHADGDCPVGFRQIQRKASRRQQVDARQHRPEQNRLIEIRREAQKNCEEKYRNAVGAIKRVPGLGIDQLYRELYEVADPDDT